MNTTTNEKAGRSAILQIALAGAHLQDRSIRTKTGSSKRSTSTYNPHLRPYFGRLEEGGWVIDKRTVPHSIIMRDVIRGPMVDPDLKPGEVDRFDPRDKGAGWMADALAESDATFGALIRAARMQAERGEKYGSLDSISIPDYAAYWQARGARIGRRKGDSIEWADGEVEGIDWTIQD